ncbi:MAG: hypothetical protein ICV64_08710 [Thermoleophilia bacterium]|nr:hypothetical protein [Thermoleophilia bacterium]
MRETRASRRLPLASDGDATLSAALPAAYVHGGAVEYYAVVEADSGESLTLPPAGAAKPQRATVVPSWIPVELGPHRFGAARAPARVVARAGWGDGAGELGLDSGPEQSRIGPSAFDVAADGSLVVLDQVNRRLARFRPAGRAVEHTAIPFSGGEGDLALAPDGTAHVLDEGGHERGPVVRSFARSGEAVATAPLAAPSADMLRMAPSGPVAHAYPFELWLPTADGRTPLEAAAQRRLARAGRPVGAGTEVVVRASAAEARFALVRGEQVVRAWRVTSPTALGEVQLAEPRGNGLLVVVRVWTETEAEFRVLELTPAGLGASFSVARAEWAESAPLSRFRVHGDRVYQLRTTPQGAQIVEFDLGGTR